MSVIERSNASWRFRDAFSHNRTVFFTRSGKDRLYPMLEAP